VAVGHRVAAARLAAVVLRVVAELRAAAALRAAVARPEVVQPVACLTLAVEPLAVVRADFHLQVVATAVAAAVE
jgi:hypothetical protein